VFSADHPIDAPVPLRYHLEAYHIPLSALEHLEHQDPYERPWRLAARLDSKTELKKAVLEEIKGEPYLTCLVGEDGIMFKNLATGQKSTLKCHKWGVYDSLVRLFHYIATSTTDALSGAAHPDFPGHRRAEPGPRHP
jgi:hypothetical protein